MPALPLKMVNFSFFFLFKAEDNRFNRRNQTGIRTFFGIQLQNEINKANFLSKWKPVFYFNVLGVTLDVVVCQWMA